VQHAATVGRPVVLKLHSALACDSHSKIEPPEGEPGCAGLAVTGRFAIKLKYFYDEENRDTFCEAHADMPLQKEAVENTWLAGGSAVTTLLPHWVSSSSAVSSERPRCSRLLSEHL